MKSFGEFIKLKESHKTGAGVPHRGGKTNQEVQLVVEKVTLPNMMGQPRVQPGRGFKS